MNQIEPERPIDLSQKILDRWQNLVDVLAELIDVPAALIMRIAQPDIEVYVSSRSDGNPYKPGDHEHLWGSGLYCETVIKTKDKLKVPNALADEEWKNNPDIKLNMISYLGYPITLPDGKLFGTICVLDDKANAYSKTFENLVINFRDIVQSELELVYLNNILGEKNKTLSDYIDEIRTLRGIIPICAKCKKIRDDEGFWIQVEQYIEDHSDAQFSHGLCEDCLKTLYGDQHWYKNDNSKG